MIGVLLANFAKFTCILVFVLSYREPVLATIGDGIASFLERPDTFTENEKLEAQYRDSRASWRVWFQKPRLAFGWWHWWQAPSKFRWFGSLISCLLALSATTIFLIYGLQRLGSKSDIFALGFGQYDDRAVLGIFGDIARDKSKFVSHSLLIKMVAMANLPQVIIFSLYFALNTIYTSMLSANEWANFSQQKKTLRTTSPEGLQRSTYWLSLPWTYGLPLSISITILHLLISQALFVGRRVIIDVFEQVDLKISQLGVGYSHVAIFASLIFGSAMVLALMVNGLRPLNPCVLAGNNSLAILGALKDIHHYWSLERLVIYYDEASEEELNQLQATATRHLHAPRLEELRQNVGRGRFPLPTIEYEKLEMKV